MKLVLVSTSARGELSGRLRWIPGLSRLGVDCLFALPLRERSLFGRFRRSGTRVRPFGYERNGRGLLQLPRSVGRLAGVFETEQPSVVHSFGHEANLLTAWALRWNRLARGLATPAIAHVTGLGAAFQNPGSASAAGLRAAYRLEFQAFSRFVFQNADDPAALPFLKPERVWVGSGTGVDCQAFRPEAASAVDRLRLRS